MKHFLAPLVIAALATPLTAQTIDVNQPSDVSFMATFSQPDLAQSFIPTVSNCSGGGIFTRAGIGSPENVTLSLWDALPTAGGTQLATATVPGTPGTWVDAFWPAVSVTPGTTYYLLFTSDLLTMGINGDTGNPYADGQVYANAGYGSFPTFDYTFRTYYDRGPSLTVTGTCPTISMSVTGARPFGAVAFLTGPNNAAFTLAGGLCAGTVLDVSPPTLRTIQGADAGGSISLTLTVPAGACGLFLQVVEIGTCGPSNVVAL